MRDIKNYSDIAPVMRISEVVVGCDGHSVAA